MSELGDDFRAMKEWGQLSRKQRGEANEAQYRTAAPVGMSRQLLNNGVCWRLTWRGHVVDFWPTTHRVTVLRATVTLPAYVRDGFTELVTRWEKAL